MPGDAAGFRDAWEQLQLCVADNLPLIPLYSNTYYDAYTNKLLDYSPQSHISVAKAILYAHWKTD